MYIYACIYIFMDTFMYIYINIFLIVSVCAGICNKRYFTLKTVLFERILDVSKFAFAILIFHCKPPETVNALRKDDPEILGFCWN